MKKGKKQEMAKKIQTAVDACIIAQDWLSLERMFSRLSSQSFDVAVSVMFGDMLISASDAEMASAAHVADYILHSTGRIPWQRGR